MFYAILFYIFLVSNTIENNTTPTEVNAAQVQKNDKADGQDNKETGQLQLGNDIAS